MVKGTSQKPHNAEDCIRNPPKPCSPIASRTAWVGEKSLSPRPGCGGDFRFIPLHPIRDRSRKSGLQRGQEAFQRRWVRATSSSTRPGSCFSCSAASARLEETLSQTRTTRHLPWKQAPSGSPLIVITRGFRGFADGTRSIERLRRMRMPRDELPQPSCPADRGLSRGQSRLHRPLAKVAAILA